MPRDTEINGYDRRTFLKSAGAAGTVAVTGLAGCAGGGGGGSTEEGSGETTATETSGGTTTGTGAEGSGPTKGDPLKIGVYGGVFKETLDSALVQPFSEDTGIPVESKAQSVGDAMVKLKRAVDADQAPVDVVVVAPDARIRGQNLGTWLNYPADDISRRDAVVPDLFDTTEDGSVVGVGGFGWFLNLTSNTNVLDEPLTSWKDLWSSEYEDQLAANRLPGDGFLLDIAAQTFDEFDGRETLESEEGINKLIDKVAEIKPQVSLWWTQEAEAQQPLKEGDIGATQMYNDVSLVMKEKGAPVETRFPEEGGVLNFGSWTVIKTTDYPDAAKQFVDYAVRPEVQGQITKSLYTAPTIRQEELDISSDLYETVYGPGPDAAMRPNNRIYLEKEQFISQQFKQKILS
jgi:putative spermidine/putrescine transport system substrate-binding protein